MRSQQVNLVITDPDPLFSGFWITKLSKWSFSKHRIALFPLFLNLLHMIRVRIKETLAIGLTICLVWTSISKVSFLVAIVAVNMLTLYLLAVVQDLFKLVVGNFLLITKCSFVTINSTYVTDYTLLAYWLYVITLILKLTFRFWNPVLTPREISECLKRLVFFDYNRFYVLKSTIWTQRTKS